MAKYERVNVGGGEGGEWVGRQVRDDGEDLSQDTQSSYGVPSDFDWQAYVGRYEDLRNAGIDTREKAEAHYLSSGKTEGRSYAPLSTPEQSATDPKKFTDQGYEPLITGGQGPSDSSDGVAGEQTGWMKPNGDGTFDVFDMEGKFLYKSGKGGSGFLDKISEKLGTDSSEGGLGKIGKELTSNPLVNAIATAASGAYAPLTSALISRAQGNEYGDVAKNAAIAYVGGKVGDIAGKAASGLGENASKLISGATAGGTRAGLSGGDIVQGALTGATGAGLGLLGSEASGLTKEALGDSVSKETSDYLGDAASKLVQNKGDITKTVTGLANGYLKDKAKEILNPTDKFSDADAGDAVKTNFTSLDKTGIEDIPELGKLEGLLAHGAYTDTAAAGLNQVTALTNTQGNTMDDDFIDYGDGSAFDVEKTSAGYTPTQVDYGDGSSFPTGDIDLEKWLGKTASVKAVSSNDDGSAFINRTYDDNDSGDNTDLLSGGTTDTYNSGTGDGSGDGSGSGNIGDMEIPGVFNPIKWVTDKIKALTGVDVAATAKGVEKWMKENDKLSQSILGGIKSAAEAAAAIEKQKLANQGNLDVLNLKQEQKLADQKRLSDSISGMTKPTGLLAQAPLKRLDGSRVFKPGGGLLMEAGA